MCSPCSLFLVLHIDSALDWQQVNAGQVIYREGDPSDSFYIVITGRLRAITEKKNSNGGVEVLAEYGMGDSVGELDVITNEPRGKTLHAIRDSELARMPMVSLDTTELQDCLFDLFCSLRLTCLPLHILFSS